MTHFNSVQRSMTHLHTEQLLAAETVVETTIAPEQETISTEAEQAEAIASVKAHVEMVVDELRYPVSFVPPLSTHSRQLLSETIAGLSELITHIDSVKTQVLVQNERINNMVKEIESFGAEFDLSIDTATASNNIAQYATLLDRIVEEITLEKKKNEDRLALSEPTEIDTFMEQVKTFDEFIRETAREAKKQIKRIRTDINVSFSRYEVSHKAQASRLSRLGYTVAYNKQILAQQHAAAQKAQATSNQ